MNFINLTPHAIVMNDGRVFSTSGNIARVEAIYSTVTGDFCQQRFGAVVGIPDAVADTMYIVSAMVMAATDREDVVAPATGHPLCQRNTAGHILSVPCFITK